MAGRSFYDDISDFKNCIYALDTAVETHYGNLVLQGELDRIIYASNAYAFRKRAEQDPNGNINLPFLNYRLTEVSTQTDRKLFNNSAYLNGIYVPEIGEKVYTLPVHISYEATFWVHRHEDMIKAATDLMFDDGNETILHPSVTVGNTDITMSAILGYSLSVEKDFDENDWLEENNIHNIGLDFEYDTYLYRTDDNNISITEEAILEFLTYKYGDDFETDDPYETLRLYFDGT